MAAQDNAVVLLPNMIAVSRADARWMTYAATMALQVMALQGIDDGKAATSVHEARMRIRYALDADPHDAPETG